MNNASLKPRSTGRVQAALAAAFLLASIAGLYGLARAGDEKNEPEKKEPEKKEPEKKDSEKKAVVVKPTGPMTLKMVIASAGADVKEVSKIIDDKLADGWKANKITPSHFIDDHEFIRRASLDIVGRIATQTEIAKYMKDPPEKRRSLLIDRLLEDQDYANHWANLWTNWLLTRSGTFGRGIYREDTQRWLAEQFSLNKPLSEIVTKLLTASGKNLHRETEKNAAPLNPAVNFLLAHVGEPTPGPRVREEGQFEMVPATSRIARVFLGTQIQCAQCHPHPFFNGLKQEMFWGINGYLRQVKMEGRAMMRRPAMGPPATLTLVDDESVNPDANVFFELRSGKVKMWNAEFLPPPGKDRGPKLDPSRKGIQRREDLAKHVVEHDMFAKAMVNRAWGLFFGRGFVNPIDDFNDNNQPSNPELLNELAMRFKHYNYDMHKLIRWIAHSNAYHRSYVANPSNDKPEHEAQFSRMVMKALSPEQLFESLWAATKSETKTKDAAKKKEERDQWMNSLVTNFGDDEGNEVTFNGTIVQALMMMNGTNINKAITEGATIKQAMTKKTLNTSITDLYLATLNRPPRPGELAEITKKSKLFLGVKDTPQAAYEDLLWALLNSNEFLLNH